ncbi:MAG: 30S ribosomal protein S4 [Deltaproteobacteria bacterium RIFOXYA12_FULL_58_15]|nr:MAG: 30S ribosomal protein S4 [Deltaproteobacteria bacterium RIFOXYA12_FULL_58_15]OGR15322.1 MAG: 30S ribosomal protein S4 [Deltaproteobacteria bacterium RIFOXYB12_FULL_58_9]
MARSTEARCRQCRRENMKLFLKGERCYTEKCAMERRPYPPGQAGQGRHKFSEFGIQLREKQKVRRIYGVLEKQFRHYYKEAARRKGITGEELLNILECRLDNVVYRLGLAASRNEGRLLVRHGHVVVNGHRVDIPSFLVKPGMTVGVSEKTRTVGRVMEAGQNVEKRGVPGWLELGSDKFSGTVKAQPTREDITIPVQEQLIVELYSK